MIRTNTAMKALLLKYSLDPSRPTEALDPALTNIVSHGMREWEGCWLLTALFDEKSSTSRAHFPDCTGYETFINLVHLDGLIEVEPTGEVGQRVAQGLAYVHALYGLALPLGAFRVIFSVSEDPLLNVSVRIHRRRPDEVWLLHDLEGYQDEALLVMDTPVPERV